jgi:integrase
LPTASGRSAPKRGKKSNAGRILLPQMARDIIEAQPHIAGNPHVFAASRGRGPIFVSSHKAELDALLPNDMPHWVLHDLRRSARSLMARAKVPDHIAERTLGHTIRGVEGVYNRYDYAEEKTGALNMLAALIDTILHPHDNNVVSMMRR